MAPQLRDQDRYDILGEHGRGGLGRVSRAHDRELGRDIAIKELISRGALGEVRFLREALITARLEHPGIVPVYEAGRWPDGTPFYAMKLVSGRPLRDLIAERKTVDERLALLHHVIAVADAMAYAHGRNIIHRDLKPANVIVGDFGETVVIDWGLAKDLSSAEEPAVAGTPFREHRDDGLTSAGAVLGTLSYMAPEQARGEPVDQRADVFAIGAMLWELCSLHKLPPGFSGQRRRMLRRSGIDLDLITIIEKALAPDPACRYPNAGTLATDLKAFKAGARIAARRYSLWALLAHWTRRHRALAVATAVAAALISTGSALYIRNIAVERDRADRSEATAITSLDELTLQHAELLLTTDPSAALDAITSYHGTNLTRARQLRAEALGLGVATLRVLPHTDSIHWIKGTAAGDIVTMSTDGTIARTSLDGVTRRVAGDIKKDGAFSYAPSRHLLAYACDPDDLCIMDITTGSHIHDSSILGHSPLALSFSPDESQLALLSQNDVLRILDVRFPEQPTEQYHFDAVHGGGVLFVERDAVAVGTSDGLRLVHIDGRIRNLVDPEGTLWDIGPDGHSIVIATYTGQIYSVSANDLRVTARAQPCHDPVSGLKTIRQQGWVAFACKEGTIGTWTPQTGAITPRAHIDGHASLLEVSQSGDYLAAGGDKGTLVLIDLKTNIVTPMRGHGSRLTAISLPTARYPLLLSADGRGAIRTWSLPKRCATVRSEAFGKVLDAIYYHEDQSLIMSNRSSDLSVYSRMTDINSIRIHTADTPYLAPSPNGRMFASYGSSDLVEVWSLGPLTQIRRLSTHHGTVSHVEFINEVGDLYTAGKDGRFVRWSPTGKQREIHKFAYPIDTFTWAANSSSTLVATEDGTLWVIDQGLRVIPLQTTGIRVAQMRTLPDLASIYVAYADGAVVLWDSRSWQQIPLTHASDTVRDVVISDDSRLIAFVAGANMIHIGTRNAGGWLAATWTRLTVPARRLGLTRDGLLVAACTDGTIWIYSITLQHWLHLPLGTLELTQVMIDDINNTAFAFDIDGRLISIDLNAVRTAITMTPTDATTKDK